MGYPTAGEARPGSHRSAVVWEPMTEPTLRHPLLEGVHRPFAAIIFDCDGTIADTMPLHYQAWSATLLRHGATMPEAVFYELAGVPTVRIVEILNQRYGYSLHPQQISHEKEVLYEEFLPRLQPVVPVVDFARQCRHRVGMGVASGGLARLVGRTLEILGIADWFSVVCTSEDVSHGKPEPDLFLLTARRLEVSPELCLVLEDADLGLEAARRAGMQSVDVRPWLPHPGDAMPDERPR